MSTYAFVLTHFGLAISLPLTNPTLSYNNYQSEKLGQTNTSSDTCKIALHIYLF